MTIPKLALVLLCLTPTLFSKDLPDVPGKEGLMLAVEYPPGASDPVHRHNAVFTSSAETRAKPNRRNS